MATRYNFYTGDRMGQRINEADNGEYVLYDDYIKEINMLNYDRERLLRDNEILQNLLGGGK